MGEFKVGKIRLNEYVASQKKLMFLRLEIDSWSD